VSAQNVAFDTDTIHLPPDAPATITFDNRDAGVQHNISIYADDTLGEILFQGEIITGPDTIDYEVGPLEAGEYYFQCDVHPNMNGTVVVGEGGGPPPQPEPTGATGATGGGEGGGAEPSTVVAQGIVFDTAEISLPAGRESSLTFDNRDAGIPHNIAIYPDQNLGEPLFQGELITGPDTIEYRIPALEAGEYYFHCDVHPSMNGSVTVA
jgi:plastocyanin